MKRVLAALAILLSAPGCGHALPSAPTYAALPRTAPAAGVDSTRLNRALDAAMADPVSERTQAILVLHDGVIVGERYASGFDRNSRFLSASVAKFVLGAAIGAAVKEDRLSLDRPLTGDRWPEGDPRGTITLRNLMQMRSGFAFVENPGDPAADTIVMLAGSGRRDTAAYVAARPLAHPPGTHFDYSSGDANLASAVLRDATGGTRGSYRAFLDRALLQPIGAGSAVVEFDAAGTWIGSSNLWARAEDYARIGWLLLSDGMWNGARLLPPGWGSFMATPTQPPSFEDDVLWQGYGAFAGATPAGAKRRDGTADPLAGTYGHMGTSGQLLLIDPARRIVIVRLGRLREEAGPQWLSIGANAAEILRAFPNPS